MATYHQIQKRHRKRRLPESAFALESDLPSVLEENDLVQREGETEGMERRQFPEFPANDPFPPVRPGGPTTSIRTLPTASTSRTTLTITRTYTRTPSTPSTTSIRTTTVSRSTSTLTRSTPTPTPSSRSTTLTTSTPSTPSTTSSRATAFTTLNEVTSSTPSVPVPPRVPTTATTSTPFGEAAGATSTPDPTGGISAGPIIGGIVAGIAGIAILALAVAYFMRREKRKRDDNAFNAKDFRRSAMLMPEPPTHADTVARGYNAPPNMAELRVPITPSQFGPAQAVPLFNDHGYGAANTPVSAYSNGGLYTAHGYPEVSPYIVPETQQYNAQTPGTVQSFSPDQIVDFSASGSANPFMTRAPYAQSPFSPVSAPSSPQNPFEEPQEPPTGTVLAQIGGAAVLTRGMSTRSTRSTGSGKAGKLSISVPPVRPPAPPAADTEFKRDFVYPLLERKLSSASTRSKRGVDTDVPPIPTKRDSCETGNDYVDLTRASVSPFQAAQYAQISESLNSEVPQGLPSPLVEKYLVAKRDADLPAVPPSDAAPVSDDSPNAARATSPAPLALAPAKSRATSPQVGVRDSVASDTSLEVPRGLNMDFPIPPPSPLYAASSRHRIASTPPCLPEIQVQPRVSVGAYTSTAMFGSQNSHNSSSDSGFNVGYGTLRTEPAFPSGVTAGASPFLNRFPVTPSPLNASFSLTPNESSRGAPNSSDRHGEESPERRRPTVFGAQQDNSLATVLAERNAQWKERQAAANSSAVHFEEPQVPPRAASNGTATAGTNRVTVYDPEDAYGGF